ncbi:cytochrome c biogenesis protein CcsA [Pseudomonas aeruginosa]
MIPELGHLAPDPRPLPGPGAVEPAAGRRLARRPPVDEPGAPGGLGARSPSSPSPSGCLTWAFLRDDFSVAYVAGNSNSALPWYYKFSAVWGAHEGSLLLWALILGGWTFAVSIFSRQLPEVMLARVLAVMGMISTGFLFQRPDHHLQPAFSRLLPRDPDGRQRPQPALLQDVGLIVHPPMPYMGYVGFSGGLRLRHRRTARRPPGRRLGAAGRGPGPW